jgi:PRTRC genetic system protein A
MNMMDQAILQAFPLVPIPVGGEVEPAAAPGIRFLIGRSGIWREITLPWILVRHQIAQSDIRLPYGAMDQTIEFRCGALPRWLIQEFAVDAKTAAPNEIAGVFLWREDSGAWRYQRRVAFDFSGAHVHYEEVKPRAGEHIVVDVHSHGVHPAGFSKKDDADDAGSMKLSLVLGNLDQQTPSSAMRLCMAGKIYAAASVGHGGELEVA